MRLNHEEAHLAFEDLDRRERSFAQEEAAVSDHARKAAAHRQRWFCLDAMTLAAQIHDAAHCGICLWVA